MASHVFLEAKRAIAAGEIDLNADDIRVVLCMTNTTADTTGTTANFLSDITLDEHDGTGAARKALANEAVNEDTANNRAEFDADDVTWTALGNGTRPIQGALLYKHVTTDANSIPIVWVEFAATQNPGGSDFVIQWNAEGIIQLS